MGLGRRGGWEHTSQTGVFVLWADFIYANGFSADNGEDEATPEVEVTVKLYDLIWLGH